MHSLSQHPNETSHRQPENNGETARSVLASLRALTPQRTVTFTEALRIAELQAARLRSLLDVTDGCLPEEAIAGLPRIRLTRRVLPTSGMSYWDGQTWVIALNAREPETRQHFTLLHEYKHILDHGHADRLYGTHSGSSIEQQAEHAADYFAGCALMPKRLVKRAWGNGIQTPEALADLFDVSPRAAQVRLAQLGLTEPVRRCATVATGTRKPGRTHTYFRSLAASNWRTA